MTNGSLMKVESIAECPWSILQYFWLALSDNWVWNPIFDLFESGHFTQVFLYHINEKPTFKTTWAGSQWDKWPNCFLELEQWSALTGLHFCTRSHQPSLLTYATLPTYHKHAYLERRNYFLDFLNVLTGGRVDRCHTLKDVRHNTLYETLLYEGCPNK